MLLTQLNAEQANLPTSYVVQHSLSTCVTNPALLDDKCKKKAITDEAVTRQARNKVRMRNALLLTRIWSAGCGVNHRYFAPSTCHSLFTHQSIVVVILEKIVCSYSVCSIINRIIVSTMRVRQGLVYANRIARGTSIKSPGSAHNRPAVLSSWFHTATFSCAPTASCTTVKVALCSLIWSNHVT
jgi:hypothetical protein